MTRSCAENKDFIFALKTDLAKGHEPKTIAQRYNLPEILVWAIKLQDKPDQEKMEELWPDAKGTSQDIVSDFLSENENFIFSIISDLSKGHEPKVERTGWRENVRHPESLHVSGKRM